MDRIHSICELGGRMHIFNLMKSELKFSISKTEHTYTHTQTHANRGPHSERKVLRSGINSHSDETWPYVK